MPVKIQTRLRRADGTPWPYPTVLNLAVEEIMRASLEGKGLRLTQEMVRALDHAVIRESGGGGISPELFRGTHA